MLKTLPKLLVSSVVRGAAQGDSHGGLYLIDFGNDQHEQLLDWNDNTINFDGRGADRGLRGITVIGDRIFIAASDELFVFDRSFRIVASFRNRYLKHSHEMSVFRGSLYLTSTGFDAILRFDLRHEVFDLGLAISRASHGFSFRMFDPAAPGGPSPSTELHLNNVFVDDHGIYVSGLKLSAILQLTPHSIGAFAEIPFGTHNARPFRGGVLLNDTDADAVVWYTPVRVLQMPVPKFEEAALKHSGQDTSGIARQGFGRGLCVISEDLVAGGSSPTTLSLYNLKSGDRETSMNLTLDVRNAAHGVAIWPF